jgi:ADP-ribose pyrophosphatase
VAERHYYFHVSVDPKVRQVPPEDGSPLEEDALIVTCPLADALDHCRAGRIVDAKTELALRRLADLRP